MSDWSDNPLKKLIHEIHRRSLWQVLGIYIVAAWVALQAAVVVGDAAELPEWFPGLALALLIIGLPVVLATAFVQEGGPGRTREETGPIVVSGLAGSTPQESASSRLFTWRFAFLGGVAAFALLGFVGTAWFLFGGGVGGSPGSLGEDAVIEPSIAVMPCDDLSTAGDQAILAQGVAEEVAMALSRLPGLKVSGRASTQALKTQNADLATVAGTLEVANVLTCTVAREDGRIRVAATLSEEGGAVLWSDRFDEDFTDVFDVLDAVAVAIVEALRIELGGDRQSQFVAEATQSTDAFEAYRRGWSLVEQRSDVSLQNAISEFERAIALDADYSEAYAGLADAYVLRGSFGMSPGFRENIDAGLAAAQTSIDLDPELGLPHASRGFGLWNLGEWQAAERAFQEAIRLSPQYAQAHQWYGLLLMTMGRLDEAVGEAERAVDLDPAYRQTYRNLSWILDASRRYEEAMEASRAMLDLAPDWAIGWENHATQLLGNGYFEEGLEAGLETARLFGEDMETTREAHEAIIRYRQTGEPQIMSAPADWPAWRWAWFYAFTGQEDAAIELIEAAIASGDLGNAVSMHVTEYGDLLGDNPRYQALMQSIGVTW